MKQENDLLDVAITKFRTVVEGLHPKKQALIADWLIKWGRYLSFEDKFEPSRVPRYKRGDVVYVDFGFNVGHEYGGIHYAAVLEVNNNKGNGNIIVVPLTSLDVGKSMDDVPPNDLYLGGGIIPWTQADTIAKPHQIRAISKMRIVKPLKKNDKWVRITQEHLDLIDHRIKHTILKPASPPLK